MQKLNLVCPHRRPNPYRRMAKAAQEHRTLPNKLKRNFKQEIPGLVLLTNITYLPYGRTETAYLSTILDAFIHSDQGFHYTNPKYQELLKQKGLGQSMSRRGNC